ncbi:MAG: ATP-binding protein [Burkholderiaceae bacterium]
MTRFRVAARRSGRSKLQTMDGAIPASNPDAAEATRARPAQRIIPIRREYNAWVADETIEDYALRYTPRSFRKWSEFRVANTALGAISFLALEAIGASIAIDFGFNNAFWAILAVSVFIFLTALPISVYAARHSVDIDLLARGSGFGYLGSTFSSLIYASFTFIFFSLEAAIMAFGLELGLGIPLWIGYLISSLTIIPLVTYGVTLISRLQAWTQPLWLALLGLPYLFVAIRRPDELGGLMHASYGINDGHFDWKLFGAAATVVASMVAHLGEQVDFLRFMPEPQPGRRRRWWAAVIAAGPGWILVGGAKMLGGAMLAFIAVRQGLSPGEAVKPTQMYLLGYRLVFDDLAWAIAFTCLFVTVSQLKINITNAYAGSLAWSNFFSRLTHAHPGRLVWLVFNVLIGMALIEVGIFDVLEGILGLFAQFAVAWIGALVADLVINKPIGWSPPGIEFRRAYLYDINPVGFVSLGLGTALSLMAFTGVFGPAARAFSTVIAFGVAFASAPLIAWWTGGRYYIAREPMRFTPGELVVCGVCGKSYESEDMGHCPAYGCHICSLCCSLDARCEDSCKPQEASLSRQIGRSLRRLLPGLTRRLQGRRVHYLVYLAALASVLGLVLSFVVVQESHILFELAPGSPARWNLVAIKICFALVLLVLAIGSCWLLLTSDSRRVAQDESDRQAALLRQEIEAHEVTDRELQEARRVADRANLAKSRFITTVSHELRTPLNSILGYAQILERDSGLPEHRRAALGVIRKSGDHVVSLIDGLLDIARIETRRLALVNTPIAFPAFVSQLADIFAPEAENKGIRLEFRPAPRLPDAVRGDKKRIAQLLLNLLGNAVKYTERGRVSFRVTHANEIAVFEIDDTGPGIADADRERIFQPFERVERADGSAPGGVGLGLAVSRMLAELMGGELSLRSTPGVGSTFTVRLFLPAVARAALPPPVSPPRRIDAYLGPRRRILIVDDTDVDRLLLRDVLAPLGFDVCEAVSGFDALRVAAERQPDLILLDIDMPGIDGWETARLLRERGVSEAPLLIVSANAFEVDDHGDVGIGRDDFLVKPVRIDDLLERIRARLALTWSANEPASGEGGGAAYRPFAAELPSAAWSSLRQLGELGYVRGILEKLDELDRAAAADPSLTRHLRQFVQRFDLAGYARALSAIQTREEDT